MAGDEGLVPTILGCMNLWANRQSLTGGLQWPLLSAIPVT